MLPWILLLGVYCTYAKKWGKNAVSARYDGCWPQRPGLKQSLIFIHLPHVTFVPEAKKNMMYIVRFGVVNSMDPYVQQIAPQNLKRDQPMSPPTQSDTIKQLVVEKGTLQKQIDDLRRKQSATTTVIQDRIKVLEKRIMQIKETVDRTKVNDASDFDSTYRVMANARIVCSTLSSAINLKQSVEIIRIRQCCRII